MTDNKKSFFHGILIILLFALAAFYIGELDFVKALSFSPMIVGILLGMAYANTLRSNLPADFGPGIQFCSKRILRIGIILYGFRLTLQDVTEVGVAAIIVDAIMVVCTIFGGVMIGKLLKLDREISILTSVGASICGAAAVLGAESALRVKPYKTAVAVSTVVIFGTISMFLYPVLYRNGIFELSPEVMGIFTGASVHEVAHVVGAGNAMGESVGSVAIIVKMIRVMMLVPVLLVISYTIARKGSEGGEKGKINTPWFAILFLVVIVLNSFIHLPKEVIDGINTFDTFLLTMAMTALGAETSFDKFKKAGMKPFVLALVLFCWLIVGGYLICKYLIPVLM
ncbi:MAG: YeiH family protein [Bacteroidales bacterium]|nr:YeiH family protein [Bacteroidales bacterium]